MNNNIYRKPSYLDYYKNKKTYFNDPRNEIFIPMDFGFDSIDYHYMFKYCSNPHQKFAYIFKITHFYSFFENIKNMKPKKDPMFDETLLKDDEYPCIYKNMKFYFDYYIEKIISNLTQYGNCELNEFIKFNTSDGYHVIQYGYDFTIVDLGESNNIDLVVKDKYFINSGKYGCFVVFHDEKYYNDRGNLLFDWDTYLLYKKFQRVYYTKLLPSITYKKLFQESVSV